MKQKEKGTIDYRLLEMLKGNDKYKLSEEELEKIPNEDMIETIKYVSSLDIQGIKIHMLFILKGTPLEKMYNLTHFHILTKEEYIDIVCDELEYLREDIIVNRITGDPIKELTVEPKWLFKKFCVLNDIDKEMVRRDSYQGIKYKKNADK